MDLLGPAVVAVIIYVSLRLYARNLRAKNIATTERRAAFQAPTHLRSIDPQLVADIPDELNRQLAWMIISVLYTDRFGSFYQQVCPDYLVSTQDMLDCSAEHHGWDLTGELPTDQQYDWFKGDVAVNGLKSFIDRYIALAYYLQERYPHYAEQLPSAHALRNLLPKLDDLPSPDDAPCVI